MSDHGLFSSYEGRQGAAKGQDSWGFFRDANSFRRLDAGPRAASPAQGLHHHVCVCVCVCVCVFIKLHITAQSGPVNLVILCHSH